VDDAVKLVASALLGSILGGGALYKLVLAALENHMRREFLPREEAKGMSDRIDDNLDDMREDVERNARVLLTLNDRLGEVEAQAGRIEERQTQQGERTGEQMARVAETINNVTTRLEKITAAQQDFALQMERLRRSA